MLDRSELRQMPSESWQELATVLAWTKDWLSELQMLSDDEKTEALDEHKKTAAITIQELFMLAVEKRLWGTPSTFGELNFVDRGLSSIDRMDFGAYSYMACR